MFEQAGCGTPAVRSLLGEGGVSEANMMQYLGILEQRTNEILQVCLLQRMALVRAFVYGIGLVSLLQGSLAQHIFGLFSC